MSGGRDALATFPCCDLDHPTSDDGARQRCTEEIDTLEASEIAVRLIQR